MSSVFPLFCLQISDKVCGSVSVPREGARDAQKVQELVLNSHPLTQNGPDMSSDIRKTVSTEPRQENSWLRIFEKEAKKDMVYWVILSVLQDVLFELKIKTASFFAAK